MLSFKLLSFDFSLKETLTVLTMLVEKIHCKTKDDIGKYYHWYSQKNLQKFQQQFSIFMNDNIEYLQVLVVPRRICQQQINFRVTTSLYIWKLKINAKLQEKALMRWDMSIHHVPTVSCINLQSQWFVFNVFISFDHVLKLSKLINSSARYQNSNDMRFLWGGRLYFNHEAFSCAMVLLITFLSKTRINFIYVNITYVYVAEFRLAWAKVIATLEFLT